MKTLLNIPSLALFWILRIVLLFRFSREDIQMLMNLAKLQLKDRYLSSRLGLIWAIIQPVSFLVIYTIVFTFAFRPQLVESESKFTYAIWVLTGMVPWLFISESVMSGANSFISYGAIIKNIVFNVKLLPFATITAAFLPLVIGLMFLLILLIIAGNYPSWHCVFLIPQLILQFLFFSALAFLTATWAVFLRDVLQILPTLLQIMIFVTPIFFPLKMMSRGLQIATFFNPLFQITEPYRSILIDHKIPDLWGMGYLFLLSLILMYFGIRLFKTTRGLFSAAL
ncbi:MAG: ABC transporter permease [Lentisphaeria bacterium]|nr:ABC transporter permease [Lentisphaeria bacterium]